MALMRTEKVDDIPKSAVKLTPHEAVSYQLDLIREWPKFWDSAPIRFGAAVLGLFSMGSSMYMNNFFRRKLKLRNFNMLASYVPTVALPALMTVGLHTSFVTCNILLQTDKCAACTQFRAMFIQTGVAIIYPVVLAPISGFMLATRNYTYRLPDFKENPKAVLKLAFKFGSQIKMPLLGLAVLNAFVAAYITYKEADSFYKINETMIKLSRDSEGFNADDLIVTKKLRDQ